MKKLLLSTLLTFISITVLSQSCLPEGIEFTTQEQIDNFQTDYPNCTEIEGLLRVNGSDISNLEGLNLLRRIRGSMSIFYTDSLVNLSGLNQIDSIGGDFEISNNANLISFSGLDNLSYVGGNLSIFNNFKLIHLSGFEHLNEISESLLIYTNTAMVDVLGFTNLISIGNKAALVFNPTLTKIEGLNRLTSIGKDLNLIDNQSLVSIDGLSNVNEIGGTLKLRNNSSLTLLSGLNRVDLIGGNIEILSNLSLISLEGLNQINASSIDNLSILQNPSLKTCNVQSICDYLVSPGGTIEIGDNAPGCNSQLEVEEACSSSIHEIGALSGIITSPNPFTSSTTLSYELQQPEKVTLTIYDYLGKQVYQTQENQPHGSQQLIWKAARFPDGIYYYQLQVGDAVANGKMVKVR